MCFVFIDVKSDWSTGVCVLLLWGKKGGGGGEKSPERERELSKLARAFCGSTKLRTKTGPRVINLIIRLVHTHTHTQEGGREWGRRRRRRGREEEKGRRQIWGGFPEGSARLRPIFSTDLCPAHLHRRPWLGTKTGSGSLPCSHSTVLPFTHQKKDQPRNNNILWLLV